MNQARLDQLTSMFYASPIVHTLGMHITFDEHAHAIVSMPCNPNVYHGGGFVQGGIYAVLMDAAGWFTAAARQEQNVWMVTSEMSIHFLAPIRDTDLRAEARIIKAGRRQDVCEMRLYNAEDKLVGHATGTFVQAPAEDGGEQGG